MTWTNGTLLVAALLAVACNSQDKAATHEEVSAGYAKPGRAGVLGTGGGGGGGTGTVGGLGPGGAPPPQVASPAPAIMNADMSVAEQTEPTAQSGQIASPTNDVSSSAMIIRTGTATIEVDSLEPAVARLRALALSVGGYVGNTSMQTGKNQLRSATVEIKVPSQRWGQLLVGLKPIGTLEAQDESAEDVGEEYVDVQARVANARRLEARLIDLLANRTGKLSDALSVERELARVREEIERYEGRMRYLKTRSAISTMTVTVHEPAPVLGNQPGDNPIAQAFRDAWRGFIGFIAGIIVSLGVLIPLAVIAWIVWMVYRRFGRKAK
jgi:hypothetical protein